MLEVPNCSALRHDPVNDAVRVDLLDDGFCHKKAGTYTTDAPAEQRLI